MKRVFPSICLNLRKTALRLPLVAQDHSRKRTASRSTREEYHWERVWGGGLTVKTLGKMLTMLSCGLISHSPKCSTHFRQPMRGRRPDEPSSHGWEGGVLPPHPRGVVQPALDIAAWPGCGAGLLPAGAKRAGLCVNDPRWVPTGCPRRPALQGGHLQASLLLGLF